MDRRSSRSGGPVKWDWSGSAGRLGLQLASTVMRWAVVKSACAAGGTQACCAVQRLTPAKTDGAELYQAVEFRRLGLRECNIVRRGIGTNSEPQKRAEHAPAGDGVGGSAAPSVPSLSMAECSRRWAPSVGGRSCRARRLQRGILFAREMSVPGRTGLRTSAPLGDIRQAYCYTAR